MIICSNIYIQVVRWNCFSPFKNRIICFAFWFFVLEFFIANVWQSRLALEKHYRNILLLFPQFVAIIIDPLYSFNDIIKMKKNQTCNHMMPSHHQITYQMYQITKRTQFRVICKHVWATCVCKNVCIDDLSLVEPKYLLSSS